jgi:ParB-like chromosome segregation protein Spo0J
MAAKKASPDVAAKPSKLTRLQKFDTAEISRSAIQAAPYNPRQIDAHAAKKLRNNIQKTGLLAPILVNKRTGNVVSGHQRLAALDALEGSPNYKLVVNYCDLTAKQEREQNIFMNNEAAMGSWDLDALDEMIRSTNIDINLAGFEDADLQLLLPDWTPLEIETPEEKVDVSEAQSAEQMADKIAEIKAAKKKSLDTAREADDTEFFMVTVFRTRNEMDAFLDSINVNRANKYVAPAVLLAGVRALIAKEKASGKQKAK